MPRNFFAIGTPDSLVIGCARGKDRERDRRREKLLLPERRKNLPYTRFRELRLLNEPPV
jgi:hypothetical protein